MAIVTSCPLAGVRAGVDREPSVIERGSQPGGGAVTGVASGREPGSDVVRVRDRLVFRLVTAVAVGRCSCEHVVHVAAQARRVHMRARERESRVVMVERRGLPGGGRMADGAIRREPSRFVVRIRRAVVIVDMTAGTSWVELVIVIHVAHGAL